MRKPISKKVTEKLIKQYQHRCFYCNCSFLRGKHILTIDHVIPVSQGGTSYEANLVPACRRCNYSKGPRTYEEWRADEQVKREKRKKQWETQLKIQAWERSGMPFVQWLHSNNL